MSAFLMVMAVESDDARGGFVKDDFAVGIIDKDFGAFGLRVNGDVLPGAAHDRGAASKQSNQATRANK